MFSPAFLSLISLPGYIGTRADIQMFHTRHCILDSSSLAAGVC